MVFHKDLEATVNTNKNNNNNNNNTTTKRMSSIYYARFTHSKRLRESWKRKMSLEQDKQDNYLYVFKSQRKAMASDDIGMNTLYHIKYQKLSWL